MEKRIKDNRPYVLLKNVRYFMTNGVWIGRKGFKDNGEPNMFRVKDELVLEELEKWEELLCGTDTTK